MKIGILGPGNIAEKMAYTINHMEDAQCYAVAFGTGKGICGKIRYS